MDIKEKARSIEEYCEERKKCKGCLLQARSACWTFWDKESEKIVEENYDMIFGEKNNGAVNYWQNVCEINAKQEQKGMDKYGQRLEENVTLSTEQRIEHLEEELIDALKYCEHLKMSVQDSLTSNDYQRMAMRTASGMDCSGVSGNGLLLNGVMGLNGESGECIDIMKKHLFQGHELDREHLMEELGDCAWYLAVSCEALGVTLEEVLQRNIDKLKERYPEGFDKARSINREN